MDRTYLDYLRGFLLTNPTWVPHYRKRFEFCAQHQGRQIIPSPSTLGDNQAGSVSAHPHQTNNSVGVSGSASSGLHQHEPHNAGGTDGVRPGSSHSRGMQNARRVRRVRRSSTRPPRMQNAGGTDGVRPSSSRLEGMQNASGGHGGRPSSSRPQNPRGGGHGVRPSSSRPQNPQGLQNVEGGINENEGSSSQQCRALNLGYRDLPQGMTYYDFMSTNTSYSDGQTPEEGTLCLFCLSTVRGHYTYGVRPCCCHYYHLECYETCPRLDYYICILCTTGTPADFLEQRRQQPSHV